MRVVGVVLLVEGIQDLGSAAEVRGECAAGSGKWAGVGSATWVG